jgi:sulfite exporter TauE/SafE
MDTSVLLTVIVAGLTTGGLTCFAVQGGLLTSLLSQMQKAQSEIDPNKKIGQKPVIYFLLTKLVVYTILGAILGAFGSLFEISSTTESIIQLIGGIYMIGVACQLLNLHPVFRYFIFQPPFFIQRYVRKVTKGNDQLASPILLGAMTVFIPCGVTLAMEALAISSGSALTGALIMFLFTLSTSWVFFGVSFATQLLNRQGQQIANKITSALLIVLGLYTVNSSLYLLGIPFAQDIFAKQQPVLSATTDRKIPADFDTLQRVYVKVEPNGYQPDTLKLKKNVPTEITLETNNVYTCALAFTIPSMNIKKVLEPNGIQKITFTPTKSGKLPYSCTMGMYRGEFIVE